MRKTFQPSLFDTTFARARAAARKRMVVQAQIAELQGQLSSLYITPGERATVHAPSDAAGLVMTSMSSLEHEELWVINLNTRNGVMSVNPLYRGSTNNTQVKVGDVFKIALVEGATSIIVLHNHPSGDPTPSADDVAVTRGIVSAGKLLDIEVLDHIVVSGGRFISLKERSLGFESR